MQLWRRRGHVAKCDDTLWDGGWDKVESGRDKNIEDYRKSLNGSIYKDILQTIFDQKERGPSGRRKVS